MKEILTLFEIVGISRLQFKMFLKTEFVFHRAENIVEKKSWLPVFSPFPTMFSKGYFVCFCYSKLNTTALAKSKVWKPWCGICQGSP